MNELMLFLSDLETLKLFILLWSVLGAIYFLGIDHEDRCENDNIFGIILALFLCGPILWGVVVMVATIWGLLAAFRLKQIDLAVRNLFRR